MCIYTRRSYSCWCNDYYVKVSNHCEASLRSSSGEPCPKPTDPSILSRLEKEKCGICDFHLAKNESKLLAQGIPNPGYTQTEEGALRRANTTRNSNSNVNQEVNAGDDEAEAQGLGIRTSKTFPLSPPPAAPFRSSEPTLPNPFHIPKLLQRSKTSARPTSQRSEPAQVPEVPNPSHLQRSQTAVQPTTLLRPKELQRSQTTAPPRSQPPLTQARNLGYIPITAQSILSPKSTLSPLRGTKPVQAALRDKNGFFIDPTKFEESLPPPSPQPDQADTQKRYSTTSSRNGPLSPPRPLSERAFQNPGPSPHRNSDPIKSQLLVRPNSGSTDPFFDPVSREDRRLSELERRRSNRVSYVYQKADEDEDLYPRPLQTKVMYDRQVEGVGRFRESGVRRWMDGVQDSDEDEELKSDYIDSGEEGDVKMVDGDLYPQALRIRPQTKPQLLPGQAPASAPRTSVSEKKERRKSVRRKSKIKPPAGWASDEEEILYSGSEYKTEYSYRSNDVLHTEERVKYAELDRTHTQPQSDLFQHLEMQLMDRGKNATGKAIVDEEEEVIYSDGEYETDYRYSDDD
ncbi:hypothetical protein N431DRAFT_411452 [Stipitochalara longipes BDJ]|nr:hypothetical protein N431DRAFT_411452 [Stipitochalara longipes BDJ]